MELLNISESLVFAAAYSMKDSQSWEADSP